MPLLQYVPVECIGMLGAAAAELLQYRVARKNMKKGKMPQQYIGLGYFVVTSLTIIFGGVLVGVYELDYAAAGQKIGAWLALNIGITAPLAYATAMNGKAEFKD